MKALSSILATAALALGLLVTAAPANAAPQHSIHHTAAHAVHKKTVHKTAVKKTVHKPSAHKTVVKKTVVKKHVIKKTVKHTVKHTTKKPAPIFKGKTPTKVYPVPSHSEGPFGCVNLPLVYGKDGRLIDTTGQFTREGTAYHLDLQYVGAVTRVAGSMWTAVKPSENFCNVTFLYLKK